MTNSLPERNGLQVNTRLVIALVNLPESCSEQSIVYYPNENRVELLDEALPEDPITTVLEALDKRPLTNNQLPLRENTCFPLVVDRVPLERLSVQEGLMLLDGNREIGRLVNHRQKQQWSGQGPVALSTLIADCRPQDKVALIHSGDGQVYRLSLIHI